MSKLLILGHVPLVKEHPDYGSLARHPGRWVYDQALALQQYSQYKVTLVTLVRGASCDHVIEKNNVRIIYLRSQPRFRVWTLFLWDIRRLRALIRDVRPSIVHAHGIEDAYSLAIRSLKIPKILTLQSLYEYYNDINPVKWWSAPKLIERLENRALRGVDCVIVKTQQFSGVVKKYHPEIKCIVIANTINQAFLNVRDIPIRRNKLAFVGTICPRKGFHIIREALERIDSMLHVIELHVYGDGGDIEYIENEFNAIRKAGHKLVEHGSVSAEKLADELMSANILIAPSYAETFGNQVIEGLLCCCHCIVSENTGMAENIRLFGHGTVVGQRASTELMEAILSQIDVENFEKEMMMRRKARDEVIDAIGPEAISAKLSKVYDERLNGLEIN